MSDNRRRFSRLGIICTILKKRENIHGRILRVVKLETEAFNFAKSNNPQWVFSMVPNSAKYHNESYCDYCA